MNLRSGLSVSGRPLVQEQQGISIVEGIGIKHLHKQLCRIGELRLKLCAHLFTNRVATLPNARSDGGFEVAGNAAEVAPHLPNSLLYDSCDRASPARVKGADGLPPGIDHQHRNAIGGLDGQQQARGVGDQTITGERLTERPIDPVYDGGVNLLHLKQGPGMSVRAQRTHFAKKQPAIVIDVFSRVVRCETEIQGAAAITCGGAAETRAEAVDQPWQGLEIRRAQDFERSIGRSR